jgi:hypothetical protein
MDQLFLHQLQLVEVEQGEVLQVLLALKDQIQFFQQLHLRVEEEEVVFNQVILQEDQGVQEDQDFLDIVQVLVIHHQLVLHKEIQVEIMVVVDQ